jgi:hypothetical protein
MRKEAESVCITETSPLMLFRKTREYYADIPPKYRNVFCG